MKTRKRIVSIVLCFLICLLQTNPSVITAKAEPESGKISEISVSGLPQMQEGDTIQSVADMGLFVPDEAGYSIYDYECGWLWDPYDEGYCSYETEDGQTFEAGMSYVLQIGLICEEGHMFSLTADVSLNGTPASVKTLNSGLCIITYSVTVPGEEKTLSFDGNGATGSVTPITKTENHMVTLPTSGFTAPTGKELGGWEIDGIPYLPGSQYKLTETTVATAIWQDPVTFTVTFDMQGHGTQISPETGISVNGYAVEPAEPSEDGMLFGGWYLDKECTTEFDFSEHITDNLTIYAKWTKMIAEIAITGIVVPVIGETPAEDQESKLTVSDNDACTPDAGESGWMYSSDGSLFYWMNNEEFKEDLQYQYSIILIAEDGYGFSDDTKVSVNGRTADMVSVNATGTSLEIGKLFTAIDENSEAHAITVTGGTCNREEAKEGESVFLTATMPEDSEAEFLGWNVIAGTGVVLDNSEAPNTGFTMVGEDVEVEAVFRYPAKTVSVPTKADGVYNGSPVAGYETTEDESLFTVTYQKTNGAEVSGVPVNAGMYKAIFSLNDKENSLWKIVPEGLDSVPILTTEDQELTFAITPFEIEEAPTATLEIATNTPLGTEFAVADCEWSGLPEGTVIAAATSGFTSWNGLSHNAGIITVEGELTKAELEREFQLDIGGNYTFKNAPKLTIRIVDPSIQGTVEVNGDGAELHELEVSVTLLGDCIGATLQYQWFDVTDGKTEIPDADSERFTPGLDLEGHVIVCEITAEGFAGVLSTKEITVSESEKYQLTIYVVDGEFVVSGTETYYDGDVVEIPYGHSMSFLPDSLVTDDINDLPAAEPGTGLILDTTGGSWTVTMPEQDTDIIFHYNHVHAAEEMDGQDATCTEDGWYGYFLCEGCGGYFEDEECSIEIADLDSWKQGKGRIPGGHEWESDYTVDKDPSCTEEGSKSIHCANCDATKDITPIEKTEHNWENDYTIDKDPSCTEEGSKSIHCADCDATKDVTPIEKTEHNWENDYTIDKAPSCTEEGSKSIHCADCDATKDVTPVEKTEHNWESDYTIDKAPSCTEEGSKSIHCADCDATKDVTPVEKTEHNWESDYTIDKDPSCTEEGSKSIHCADCDATKDVTPVEKTEHNWESDYTIDKDPSCTEEGSKSIHCADCDATKDVTPIEKLAHEDEDGDGACDICGEEIPHSPIRYEIIEGACSTWQKGSQESLTIVSEASIEKLEGALISNGKVTCFFTNESGSVKFETGSTKAILMPSFLETLEVGEYVIEIISTDGSATTTFTIVADPGEDPEDPGEDPGDPLSPATGDTSSTVLFIVVACIAGATVALLIRARRKRDE